MIAAVASAAGAARDVVPWAEAGRHAGELVVVEGFVRAVRHEDRRLTLVFDPDDPRALRVTLLIPLLSDLPPEPEALYRSRRVRVEGRITRAAGRLDLVVADPGRIHVIGLTAADGEAEATPSADVPPPTMPVSPPTSTAPNAPPAVPAPSPRPPRPSDAAAARTARAEAACRRLAASRDAARREALDAVAALRTCLDADHSGCTSAADAIAAPIARLEWIEQALAARCPATR